MTRAEIAFRVFVFAVGGTLVAVAIAQVLIGVSNVR